MTPETIPPVTSEPILETGSSESSSSLASLRMLAVSSARDQARGTTTHLMAFWPTLSPWKERKPLRSCTAGHVRLSTYSGLAVSHAAARFDICWVGAARAGCQCGSEWGGEKRTHRTERPGRR